MKKVNSDNELVTVEKKERKMGYKIQYDGEKVKEWESERKMKSRGVGRYG